MSTDPRFDHPGLDPRLSINKVEKSAAELADQFAAQVLKSAMKPAPDGLNVLQELAQRPSTNAKT